LNSLYAELGCEDDSRRSSLTSIQSAGGHLFKAYLLLHVWSTCLGKAREDRWVLASLGTTPGRSQRQRPQKKSPFQKRRLTGQSLRLFGCSDAAELVKNVAEAASDTSEESAIGVVWQRAAKHLQNELGGIDGK
jgi:hypothetical protein